MVTFTKAQNGEIELIKLTKRANNSNLPKVEIVDLREELANGNRSIISNRLYEKIEEKPFMVVKRDERRQPFDRQKLEKGIERALEKRSVTTGTIENLVIEIEDQAMLNGKTTREITTEQLGEIVLEKLYKLDKVAYIRFASAYKHFENLEEFITEVKNVERAKK